MFRIFKIIFIFLSLLFSLVCFSKDINITVTYNNVPYDKDLTTSWGISIFIEGLEKSILFDTGADGSILLSNMEKLGIDPKKIEIVMLSHIHMDHIGGLEAILEKNNKVYVYLPSSFSRDFKNNVRKKAKEVISVKDPIKVCKQVWSTGELGTLLKEQSLVIDTPKGLVVITGCAHPGIVNIVKFAKDYLKKDVYLVLGGFHLMSYNENQVKEIIRELKALKIKKIAPSHCTGGKPIELFREAWDKNFIELGCGAKLKITF